jgi:hypothetical protein
MTMLFEARFKAALRAGTLSLTFRYWRAPRVRQDVVYRVAPDLAIRVTSVRITTRITAAEAKRAGFDSVTAAREYLTRFKRGEDRSLYRIEFERVAMPVDARAVLASQSAGGESLAELQRRLTAMDRRNPTGAWTHTVLQMIAAAPGRRAGDLAGQIGWETARFKTLGKLCTSFTVALGS